MTSVKIGRTTTALTGTDTEIRLPFRTLAPPERAKFVAMESATSGGTTINVGDELKFPFGPQDLNYSSYETRWVEIQRPGKTPILTNENKPLRSVSFDLMLANNSRLAAIGEDTGPILDQLEKLEIVAREGVPCKFVYGLTALPYLVAISKFSFRVLYRDSNGSPTRVKVSLQLTEFPVLYQELTELLAVHHTPVITEDIPSPPEEEEEEEEDVDVDSNHEGGQNAEMVEAIVNMALDGYWIGLGGITGAL